MDDRLSVSALCFPGMPPFGVLETVAAIGAAHTTLHVAAVAEAGPAAGAFAWRFRVGVDVAAHLLGVGPTLEDTSTWAAARIG